MYESPFQCLVDGIGAAVFAACEDYEAALDASKSALDARPKLVAAYPPLLASLGHLGRRADAAPHIRRLNEDLGDFSVQSLGHLFPLVHAHPEYAKGLEKAGIGPR